MTKLSSLATEDEIEAVNAYRDGARRQYPAWATIYADDLKVDYPRMRKHHLANEAVGRVAREKLGDMWLAAIAKRIFQTSDYEDSAAAMAELRCYGSLLEAGIEVRPIRKERTPTADFEFEVAGDIGIVEVATKLEPEDQTERARLIEQGQTPEGVLRTSFDTSGARVDLVAYAAHPFGAPDPMKPGDTTQTNAISKICGVKAKEKQAVEGRASILWIDFRDLSLWPGVLSVCDTTPLMSGRNATLTSGPFCDRPPRGGPSSKLVQGRPLLHGSLGRRSRRGERSRPGGEGRHEHLRGRWSVAERGVRAHAVVV